LPSLSPALRDALAAGRPVVALESTIITHGMPFPQNLAMARRVEAIVREQGAVPATIALLHGRAVVDADAAALEHLAREGLAAAKASTRDLAALLVAGRTAGTTVAATMRLAALAGIAVFATGGIGGVHRGAAESFDISADLDELGSSPVTVVCAGAKSILDIPKTLEVLETRGVPVLGYRTDEFPAFFARGSGEPVPHRCDSPEQVAAVIAMHRRLGGIGGVLVVNPVPEAAALDAAEVEASIAAAVAEAARDGVAGKALTPFLLQRLVAMTGGRTLQANLALVENNARLAAEIAVALASGTGA